MRKKVVICGVDTGTLPRLTAKESKELMDRVKKGDDEARSRFILCNIRLVLSVLQKYSAKVSNPDDIFQVGCIGLVKSVDNFDNTMNVRFSTYAVPMIVGEIRRYLRESNSMRVSRGIRDVAYLALSAREEIERTTEKIATMEEIAVKINKSVSDVVYVLDAISQPLSLYDPVYNDGVDSVLVMDQIKDEKNCEENWITKVSMSTAIEKLNEREKQIVLKRYFEGKTQIEVSGEVGISQAQVSRLEKNAVEHIRGYF
ncbi:MAG: sigma-70 family RNA polymerase sigma factor [Clostridia bacterium]